jgi:hypothetical protein
MALTALDRRRILLASTLTIVALPALWLANRPDSGAPSVAVAGLAVDPTGDPAALPLADDRPGAPVFFDGPSSQVGAGIAEIAVPAAPTAERSNARVSFRSDVPVGICQSSMIGNGQSITVVNLDNNRSITCTTVLTPTVAGGELVIHPDVFSRIADLTDTPIPVEIRR